MRPIRLKAEHLCCPLGLSAKNPLLSWNAEGGTVQTAYQIVTESWDSGKVKSSSMSVRYPEELSERQRVNWKVRLWDENDQVGEWVSSFFEMGLDSWKAKWICGAYNVNKKLRYPVDCFKKSFNLISKVSKARLYITSCGVYEACINKKRVGSFILAPGITDYRCRIQYQCYDVTELLGSENEITVALADGWYRGSVGAWGLRNQYGKVTKLLAQLEVTYEGGQVFTLCTDDTWSWSNDGPIREADNKDGEVFDSRMVPSYKGKAKLAKCEVVPVCSDNVFVTEHEIFKPTVIRTPKGKTVLDFGQNIAGYVSFTVSAHEGDTLVLRFGEMLDSFGEFTQDNIQLKNKKKTTPLQRVKYIASEGRNTYKTSFAIFGFQYALLEGFEEVNAEDFSAIAVYSDMEETSQFECSNELLNKFYKATIWSAKNNSCDLPTDCPTRERHGWSGDAQIFSGTASFLFDYYSFAHKFVRDLEDTQHKDGNIGQIAPYGGVDFYMKTMDGSAGWSDAICYIPWNMYEKYRDVSILEKHYESMKAFSEYKIRSLGRHYMTGLPTGLKRKDRKNISNYGQSYGEWAEPADVKAFSIKDFINPHPEETTAYIVYLMSVMKKVASLLGKVEDSKRYEEYESRVRAGYQALVSTAKYSLDTDRQAKLVRPLYFDLLNDNQASFARKRLIQALDNYSWRLGTGFLSTPLILYVLSSMDKEYAYRLLENEQIPGWLSMPKNGASTIWEAWEGPSSKQGGIGSLNHYSKGAVMQWVFEVMCGINVVGERAFRISPLVGGSFSYASFSYDSFFGKVSSSWKREVGVTKYTVEIPCNCSATVVIDDAEHVVGPGKHTFEGKA